MHQKPSTSTYNHEVQVLEFTDASYLLPSIASTCFPFIGSTSPSLERTLIAYYNGSRITFFSLSSVVTESRDAIMQSLLSAEGRLHIGNSSQPQCAHVIGEIIKSNTQQCDSLEDYQENLRSNLQQIRNATSSGEILTMTKALILSSWPPPGYLHDLLLCGEVIGPSFFFYA
jgi:hypothetical protein